jgi:hypothetical protein
MEMPGIIALAVVWFLVTNLIGRTAKNRQSAPRAREPRPTWPPADPTAGDPTQREGTRLEAMLRELQRSLEVSGRQEGSSLEVEPETVSLENLESRPLRRRVDQDDEAEQVAARRIKAAAARDTAQAPADHAAFDERIRQQPADHTAVRTYTTQQLRDAMVWREILGSPVSLRDESGAGS